MAKTPSVPDSVPPLPREPVQRLVEPLVRFTRIETASGVVLLAATVAALVLANSPWAEPFADLWKTPVGFQVGDWQVQHKLVHWINDGLMAIFFFVIGLEVKRELVLGELRDLRAAMLPLAAAIGGMILPAGVYLALQAGQPAAQGWGIPMATDIAFVVGSLALLGPRVPPGLRIVMLSLAIVDDIGAILVIALGYAHDLQPTFLVLGFLGVAGISLLARLGVRSIAVYTLCGAAVWFLFHESGIHPTIAGVILGLLTPARSWISSGLVSEIIDRATDFFEPDKPGVSDAEFAVLRHMEQASREAIPPLERLESRLHPWVGFAIVPIFALANAGVTVEFSPEGWPVTLAVAAGLVIGKPVGIVLLSWLAVKAGWAHLPAGVSWGMLAAGGVLAGIGFTMALFIADLALDDMLLDAAKLGVLAGSLIAALLGMALLAWQLPRSVPKPA